MSDASADLPFFFVDPRIKGQFLLQPPPLWLQFTWGEATVTFHQDGRLVLTGCPTMDAAAQAFWRSVAQWAPAGMLVLLPEGYGEAP